MKITINGTFDENVVSFSKELKGFTAISSVTDTLFTFERNDQTLIANNRANNEIEDLISTNTTNANLTAFRGIVVKIKNAWAKDVNDNLIFENNIPQFNEELHNRI